MKRVARGVAHAVRRTALYTSPVRRGGKCEGVHEAYEEGGGEGRGGDCGRPAAAGGRPLRGSALQGVCRDSDGPDRVAFAATATPRLGPSQSLEIGLCGRMRGPRRLEISESRRWKRHDGAQRGVEWWRSTSFWYGREWAP
jgi:hypothetical protein